MWVWRSRSSLRGFCFVAVVPWFLATFYRFCGWRCGTWVDPALLAWTYHCFRLGAWSLGLASSSVASHPSPSHGLARLGGSGMSPQFEMSVFIISWKYWISFLKESLVPSTVTFDSFSSCPGSYGREGGSAGLCLHPPASMAPDPQRLSGSPH